MSWLRMALRDFVIVQSLDLDLNPGYTVLTGETGAGKSILIDALQLVLGGRSDASVVREGATRCEVVAEFAASPDIRHWLTENGFDAPEGEPLQIKRQVDAQGRSRAWINGGAATLTQLKVLADELVDIHGQHAWQGLTRPDTVRQLLDDYAGLDIRPLRQLWAVWRDALRALDDARSRQTSLQEERDRLQWQLAEIDKLDPRQGEWEEINLQHGRLAHAQGIMDAAQQALNALDGDDDGATHRLNQAIHVLQAQQHIEPRYAELAGVLQAALAQIDDACHDLQHHAERTELDPTTLEALDQRLAAWLSLARRHRCVPDALVERRAEWQQALIALERDADIDALQKAEREAHRAFVKEAQRIGASREGAAQRLSQAITQAMQGLGMEGGRFEVRLQALAEPQSHGLESVEFLVAGHPGSTPRPVGKVASGGELSRIALAIAVTTSQLGRAPTLIFDEVDSGIGGAVAHTVGQLMRRLGADRQVLAVTHLPQVAACAHQHLLVQKSRSAQGATSRVTPAAGDARVQELARMLGGDRLTDTTLAHARELICSSS